MSLTFGLSYSRHPVSAWMRCRFPLESRLVVVKPCGQSLRAGTTLLPDWPGSAPRPYPYNLPGTALDYRLRLYFGDLPAATMARQGAVIANRCVFQYWMPLPPPRKRGRSPASETRPEKPAMHPAITEFFKGLRATTLALQPAGRRLAPDAEAELGRYCVGLALFEQIARADPLINSPLRTPRPLENAEQILDLAAPEVLADLAQLSYRFYETCGDLIEKRYAVSQTPSFAGSSLIGGGDGDFMAEDCLWEVKASKHPKLCGDWLYQLLGYVLLDFQDEHQIRAVGIYMARQGQRFQWTVEELLDALTPEAARRPAMPFEVRLANLRGEFEVLLVEERRQAEARRQAK
jgi:hypothetical protein